jgi:hypothetical protein
MSRGNANCSRGYLTVQIDEKLLETLADELAFSEREPTIQVFFYAGCHVVRDVALPWAEQELWRKYGTGEDYDRVHAEAMRRAEVERLRKAFARASVRLAREAA